jgi:lipopolysaccharide transport system permease protein
MLAVSKARRFSRENEMDKFDVVIAPKTRWFDINLQELWKYRDLITLFVKRNFIPFH